jgi:hypothetical protein
MSKNRTSKLQGPEAAFNLRSAQVTFRSTEALPVLMEGEMSKRSLCYAASLVLSIAVGGSASAQDTVKVGMVMPLTGPLAAAGQQVLAGARLYVKQHGDTVGGKKVELIVKDDNSSGEAGKRLIQELIVNDRVDIIGGGLTADLLPSAGMITEAQKPTVIMLSSTTAASRSHPSSPAPVARSRNPRRSWPSGP